MLKIAHRGASASESENTFAAFSKAIALGADAIELDIRQCGTGEWVVFHDEDLQRIAGVNKRVDETSLASLQAMNLGIQTLHEVLSFIDRRVMPLIEVKQEKGMASLYGVLAGFLARGWQVEDMVVISSRAKALKALRAMSGELHLGVNIHGNRALKNSDWEIAPYSINPEFSLVNKELVKLAHQKGVKIFPWTVNEVEGIEAMRKLGVDGVMSDYLDRF